MKSTEIGLSPKRVMQVGWGYSTSLIIETAVKLRVFDVLNDEPKTLAQLAAETGASERGLRAIANALVGLEFLEREGQKYKLTPESAAFLVSSSPEFHGGLFNHISSQLLPTWLQLTDCVRTGRAAKPVNNQGHGPEFFAQFVEALWPMSHAAATALGEHLQIPKSTEPVSVLDIAAGSGVWGISLAKQSPNVRVRAVDWPEVLEVTKKVARKHGVGERLTGAPGDLMEADFGTGHQVATLGHILHSEGIERSKGLLKRVYEALAPGGVIAIQEFVPNDERTGPPLPLIFAVNMLVMTDHGDTFTFNEMNEWLSETGFKNPRLLEAPSVSPLILANKP